MIRSLIFGILFFLPILIWGQNPLKNSYLGLLDLESSNQPQAKTLALTLENREAALIYSGSGSNFLISFFDENGGLRLVKNVEFNTELAVHSATIEDNEIIVACSAKSLNPLDSNRVALQLTRVRKDGFVQQTKSWFITKHALTGIGQIQVTNNEVLVPATVLNGGKAVASLLHFDLELNYKSGFSLSATAPRDLLVQSNGLVSWYSDGVIVQYQPSNKRISKVLKCATASCNSSIQKIHLNHKNIPLVIVEESGNTKVYRSNAGFSSFTFLLGLRGEFQDVADRDSNTVFVCKDNQGALLAVLDDNLRLLSTNKITSSSSTLSKLSLSSICGAASLIAGQDLISQKALVLKTDSLIQSEFSDQQLDTLAAASPLSYQDEAKPDTVHLFAEEAMLAYDLRNVYPGFTELASFTNCKNIELENSLLVCGDSSTTLKPLLNINACMEDRLNVRYTWLETGSREPELEINESGIYTLLRTQANCPDTQLTIQVTYDRDYIDLPESFDYCKSAGDTLSIVLDKFPQAKWSDGTRGPEFIARGTGRYSVRDITTLGCVRQDTFVVHNTCQPRYWAPTAFSPNGDGINDAFGLVGDNLVGYKLLVLDRWGQEVFSTENQKLLWDGLGKNQSEASPGLYHWVLQYQEVQRGKSKTMRDKGEFTLIR